MLLLFTAKKKIFLSEVCSGETDPLGGTEGIEIIVMQRYICLWGIPYSGTRKIAKAYSISTGHQIPVLLWTETMKKKADAMISQASGAWKNRIVGQVILLALAAFIGWIFIIGYNNTNNSARQAEYVQNPVAGDIILASVMIQRSNMPSALKVLRIEEIRGDSLVIVRGYQSEDTMEQYRIKNKNKLIGLFNITENAFANTREVYSLSKYREGNKRLQRIRREGLTGAEREEQDSILNHTDIIEPIYVKRIKK